MKPRSLASDLRLIVRRSHGQSRQRRNFDRIAKEAITGFRTSLAEHNLPASRFMVEALANWVFDKDVLEKVSGHIE